MPAVKVAEADARVKGEAASAGHAPERHYDDRHFSGNQIHFLPTS